MTVRRCPITHAPISNDRYASPTAAQQLRDALQDLPDLMQDLFDLTAKLYRFTERNGPANSETPLPIDLAASETAWTVRQTILTHTDHQARARNEPTPDNWDNIRSALIHWAADLTTTQDGTTALTEILDALHRGRQATDRPAERHYAGPCTNTTDDQATPCDGELYANPRHATVQCPRCGTPYPVTERRTWLIEQSENVLATGPDIARAVGGEAYGRITINLSTLRQWASDGKLNSHGTRSGRPLYRLGDVLDLAIGHKPADLQHAGQAT